MAVCTTCEQENPEGARFCNSCAAPLIAVAEPAREVRKVVTAVFCDVVGSTPLGERLDPEALRRVMGRYFDEMRVAVEGHGGRVEKFIGDAVVAVFGVPQLHEDDALRAVRAAAEMHTRLAELNRTLLAEWDVELETRIGISTGEVVVGTGDETVLGDVMNTAARLEQAAGPGEILIGSETHRLVSQAITAEPVDALDLKGKQAPVGAWSVRAVDIAPAPAERRFGLPLVGRERELGLVRQAFDRSVTERRSGLVTVLGLPGIGKSRLAHEISNSLRGQATVLVGQCPSYGEGITYLPVAEMVRQATGDDISAGLRQILSDIPDGDAIAGRVADVIGRDEVKGAGDESFWATRRLFETLADPQPLVLVFENIHWAEPTLLDMIDYLAEWVRERPVLLLCLARPEILDLRPTWAGGKINAVTILLEALAPDEVERLVADRLNGRPIAPELLARITASAQGVPLFVEQLLAMLDDQELGASSVIPPKLQALLSARLEALDPIQRALLECASVEGERFHAGALAAERNEPLGEVLERLQDLIRRELIRSDTPDIPGEPGFQFAHALIHDAAYARLSKAERARLHEQLAEWLEQRGGGDELVGFHLERAYTVGLELGPPDEHASTLARRASALLATAGRRANGRADLPAAGTLLKRAADLLPAADPQRVTLLPLLGEVLADTDMVTAEPFLTEAIATARAAGDTRVESELTMTRSRVRLYADPSARPLPDVLSEVDRAIEELSRRGADAAVAGALVLRFDVEWMQGRMSGFDKLIPALPTAVDSVVVRICGYVGGGLAIGSEPASKAERQLWQLRASVAQNRAAQASIMDGIGHVQAMQGRIAEGRETARGGRDALAEMGNVEWAGILSLTCGDVDLLDDRPEAAEREFARAQQAFTAMGDAWFLSTAVVDRGLALCALGRFTEAVRVCDQPRAQYDAEWVIKWNRVQALAHAASQSPAAAVRHADLAVATAEATELLEFHAEALCDRAAILGQLGVRDRGRADLESALRLYQRKEHVVGQNRVQAQLLGLH